MAHLALMRQANGPQHFTVEYGETFASFEYVGGFVAWDDSGNGARGVNRTAVVTALKAATAPVAPRNWLG